MVSLQLDRIPLTHDYLRLPQELLDSCAALTDRPQMSNELVSAMQRT